MKLPLKMRMLDLFPVANWDTAFGYGGTVICISADRDGQINAWSRKDETTTFISGIGYIAIKEGDDLEHTGISRVQAETMYLVIDPGNAQHSCGKIECDQCHKIGHAVLQDTVGNLWIYSYIDEPDCGEFEEGEIIYLDKEEIESLCPAK